MNSRSVTGVGLFLALGCGLVGARTEWQMRGALVYVDNLFEYSPADLEAFRNRADPARFPINTADDLGATLEFSFSRRFRTAGRGTLLNLRTRLYGYVSNPTKSYGILTILVSQGLTATSRASLSFLYIPNYLIRHFRDPTTVGVYAACAFTEHLFTARVRQQVGTVTLEPRYRFEIDSYVQPFGFYDTHAHRPGAELDWEVLRGLGLALDYEYKRASAQGPVPDISYSQHRGELKVLTRPRRLVRFSLETGLSLARRQFTTANTGAVDPGHAGRVDLLEGISVEACYRISQTTLTAGYESEWREVSSPYSEKIEDIKNYRAGRFSVGVTLTAAGRS
ncbi:MAG: hypothetical protein ABIK86_05805 [candidate division WOR-3 bacterium]